MIENLLFSVNAIAPIFILIIIGYFLKKGRLLSGDFTASADKLVFRICLPCMLFVDIVDAEGGAFEPKLVIFCIVAVTVVVLITSILSAIFIKDVKKRGAFIQGVYRSNAAIFGMTLANSMFGAEGVSVLATVLPFVVVAYNFYAVLVLSICAPADVKLTPLGVAKRIAKSVVTNPLIISIVIAIVVKLSGIVVPTFAARTLGYLADSAMALALLSLGAGFTFESLKGRIGLAAIASVMKTVVVPFAAVGTAILLGFRGVDLGTVFIIFGGPVAVSSYIMAKEMNSDHETAAQIMVLTTLISLFTMFCGTFILKISGLI